jgi:hypothetical protein
MWGKLEILQQRKSQGGLEILFEWFTKSDGMRRPVSDGMLYAPKLSTRFEAQEIKETGNEED